MKYIKPKTEKEFIALFKTIAKEEFKYVVDVPVSINNRLKSSLGRYKYEVKKGVHICKGFDFNKKNLDEKYPLDKIIDTIKHELVHWEVYKNYPKIKEAHGKEFCEIAKRRNVFYERYLPRKKLNKNQYYEAKCLECNKTILKSKNISSLKNFIMKYGGALCSCGSLKICLLDKGIRRVYMYSPSIYLKINQNKDFLIEKAKDYKITLCN